jgi:hypothetical protein
LENFGKTINKKLLKFSPWAPLFLFILKKLVVVVVGAVEGVENPR